MKPDITIIRSECRFTTSRSSGPGGQHVNKTESRVELRFDILTSSAFSEAEKTRLIHVLRKKLVEDGNTIIISVQDTRSQSANKDIAVKRLIQIIEDALKLQKKRKATTPPSSAVAERIKDKKLISVKKKGRNIRLSGMDNIGED